ncbi:Profilin_superfamily [Hexamita inflata]|uniref:Profilin_superfamily n=1 Tax=Hexamita inflata TaxID=28002 RepID=A0ABP1I6H1_9EUKA
MISTGYAIMTIEEQKCNILTQNNIKFDEQNLLKLLVTREQAITIGMKINDQRYEVYQYEKKDGELQIQGRTQSMESGFAVVVIDKHLAITYYDYPLLAPSCIKWAKEQLIQAMKK